MGTEPLFWLRHGKIDKLYADWQAMNSSKRLSEVGGVSIPFNPTSLSVTLKFPLNMQWKGPTVKIREVMNIQGDLLCYEYRSVTYQTPMSDTTTSLLDQDRR